MDVCPVLAIYPADKLPAKWQHYEEINREYFEGGDQDAVAELGAAQGSANLSDTETSNTLHRIAIVGSGPDGMYACEHLLERRDLNVEIDIFDRLPTPWGLVRAGVAPDHPEKKLVASRPFEHFLRNPRVRFFGNVEVG